MNCDGALAPHYVLRWTEQNQDTIIGYANGTTFLEINKRNFRSIPILIPPEEELRTFAAVADILHRKLVATIRESYGLQQIRDALLPKLVGGQIRVPDEYEPGNLESAA